MLTRRLLLVVAVLMAITALTAGLAAPPSQRGAPQQPRSSPAAPGAAARMVTGTLDASARRPRTVRVDAGDVLRLTVRGRVLETVHVEGLDQMRALAPETPAVFDLLLDEPGLYPVRLLESGRRLGAVRVIAPRPAAPVARPSRRTTGT